MELPKPEQSPDEVDLIVTAWSEQRPDLDVSPLEVLSRLSRVARHLDAARAQAFRNHLLESWEFDVLAALRRVGSPFALSPGALASATHVTSGTMTTRVDRLLDRGFVSRFPDPHDRRGVQVQLTEEGKEAVDGAFTDLLKSESAILVGINSKDQQALAEQLRKLLDQFDVD
jgi:DNA-binding MarR family transcriptional regulator